MKVKVLSFGSSKDIIGKGEIEIENTHTIYELIDELHKLYPKLSALNNLQWALNEHYITDFSIKINNNDIVAIIPPVSGG